MGAGTWFILSVRARVNNEVPEGSRTHARNVDLTTKQLKCSGLNYEHGITSYKWIIGQVLSPSIRDEMSMKG